MVKVIWTVAALEDLESIGEFFGKDSLRYAEITVEELFESVDDETLATALLDRLLYKCQLIQLQGKSFRMQNRQTIF